MKRTISIIAAILLVALTITPAFALDFGCDVETVGEAIYLEELNSGTVIYEKNADERMYPASTTKIMTYIIVSENVSDLDETAVEITEEPIADLDPESTVMGLKDHIGEDVSVRDLLYGLMLPSGNDAALVLATFIGDGDIGAFVDLMNDKAAELGCRNTHFANPHGLYDPDHYTTARDLATITKYALTSPTVKDFAEISDTKQYTPEGFEHPLVTTNYMIDKNGHYGDYYYPYTKGIKTGYTDEAGKCLVTTAVKDEYNYLCIDLGAAYSFDEDVNYAMYDSIDLYNWAFDNIAYQTVFPTTSVVANIAVDNTKDNTTLDLVPKEDINALLPVGYDPALITTEVESLDSVEAPVNKGQLIGQVRIFYDGEQIAEADVCASADIDGATKSEKKAKDDQENLIKLILIIVFAVTTLVIILIIVIVVSKARRKKREAQRRRPPRHY